MNGRPALALAAALVTGCHGGTAAPAHAPYGGPAYVYAYGDGGASGLHPDPPGPYGAHPYALDPYLQGAYAQASPGQGPPAQVLYSPDHHAHPPGEGPPASYAKTPPYHPPGPAAPSARAPGPVSPGAGADAASGATSGAAAKAVAFALGKVGAPYCFGGTGPACFDCSGLTRAAWLSGGKSIPRTSAQQGSSLTPVALDRIQPGDIAWRPGHVGIYVGRGLVVNATKTGDVVRAQPLSGYVKAVRP